MSTLYLVATPIGNLEDITLRALRILGEVALIAAEDTRRTGRLLKHYQIETPLVSYHEHNKSQRERRLLSALEEGDVALVSDAGTPALSDPGYELVNAALEAGHRVTPVPGPSAAVAALVASGLPTDTFLFAGYMPRRAADKRRALEAFREERRTVVLYEVPHRIQRTLDDLCAALGTERRAALCRELTKMHEEILRGTLGELRDRVRAAQARGEYTLVLGGAPPAGRWDEAQVRAALAERLGAGLSPADAARQIAAQSGWPRREVYRLTLEDS